MLESAPALHSNSSDTAVRTAMDANFLMTFPILLLCALLGLAVWHDVRSRRIPNRLVFPGAFAGLALHTVLAAGSGLFTEPFGGLGLLSGLAGLALGLALLLPMYMLRAMGAGDVKLMAMVGAFLGPQAVFGAALSSLLAGGLLALTVALWQGTLVKMLGNCYQLMHHSLIRALTGQGAQVDAPATPSGELPYAIAIAGGTLAYLLFTRMPGWV
jgi:prepilin peptidase CpaA